MTDFRGLAHVVWGQAWRARVEQAGRPVAGRSVRCRPEAELLLQETSVTAREIVDGRTEAGRSAGGDGAWWALASCCHGNTEISVGFSNWGCSQAKLTHATNRHTVCDIHQCRSSKATESRFQWRPDHLWGARCGQEARGGATPGRALLGFVQLYQEEFTGTPVPLFPQIQMSRVREKLRNVAAGELAPGRPCTQDRDGHGAATLGSPLPRARGLHPRLRRCACPSA